MLKEFAALWKDGSVMRQVVEAVAQMLVDAEYVYEHAWETCTGLEEPAAEKKALRDHDRAVNRNEQEVRRMLVEHLTINPGQDTAGCLAMTIMAKDAERLGDQAKNIFDLGRRCSGKEVRKMKYFPRLNTLRLEIGKLLPKLQQAVLKSDEKLAHEILEGYSGNKDECARLLEDLHEEKDLPSREAVTTALLCRYLKRINGHVGNVASGVIFPLQNIDFVGRGLKEEQAQAPAQPDQAQSGQ